MVNHAQDLMSVKKFLDLPNKLIPTMYNVSSYANQGYYGDDRPRRLALNEVEGDYSDYIEMEDSKDNDDGQDEEGNREYAYDQNGYMVPV